MVLAGHLDVMDQRLEQPFAGAPVAPGDRVGDHPPVGGQLPPGGWQRGGWRLVREFGLPVAKLGEFRPKSLDPPAAHRLGQGSGLEREQVPLDRGLCTPAIVTRSPALAEGDSLAYFTIRRSEQAPGRWQLGAIGHGPASHQLATRIVEQINAWDQDRTADPDLLAHPAGEPMSTNMPGRVINKPNIRLILRY